MESFCTSVARVVYNPSSTVPRDPNFLLFIVADKVRARGEDVKRCRCGERQRPNAGRWRECEASHIPSRWSSGRGYLKYFFCSTWSKYTLLSILRSLNKRHDLYLIASLWIDTTQVSERQLDYLFALKCHTSLPMTKPISVTLE